eukprot:scaffold5806_cov88-Cylindrotheca_fusiformis.AAC.2
MMEVLVSIMLFVLVKCSKLNTGFVRVPRYGNRSASTSPPNSMVSRTKPRTYLLRKDGDRIVVE